MESEKVSILRREIEQLKSRCKTLEAAAKMLGLDFDLIANKGQGKGDGAFVPNFWIGSALGLINIEVDEARLNKINHLLSEQGKAYALQIAREMIGHRPVQIEPSNC